MSGLHIPAAWDKTEAMIVAACLALLLLMLLSRAWMWVRPVRSNMKRMP